jgi:hypothetical protein
MLHPVRPEDSFSDAREVGAGQARAQPGLILGENACVFLPPHIKATSTTPFGSNFS